MPEDKLTLRKKTIRVTMKDTECVRCTKKEGRYILPWETSTELATGWDNFKFLFTPSEARIPDEKTLDAEPLMTRNAKDPSRLSNPPDAGIRTTWLGHGTVLFQCDGVNILSNPNFDMRGIKYYHPGDDKRYRAPVYAVDDLPRIDIVCISNTHFDLLDLPSVKKLNEKWADMILWYVPLGVKEWMNKAGCTNVVELDWWKEDHVEFNDHVQKKGHEDEPETTFDVKVICTPSQNFHSRSTDDDNAVLWCSWVVHTPRYKLFICGGTGYCEIFKVIGHKYGPFHISALPIGGYHPVEKFGYSAVTPEQAVQIHRDLLSMCSVATTWGTFNLTDEYYLEPPQRLNAELKRLEMNEMQFYLLKHGESRLTEIKEAPHTEDDDDCQAPQVTHLVEGAHADGEVEDAGNMLQNLVDNFVDQESADAHIDAEGHGDVEYDGNGHAEFDQAEMDAMMLAASEVEGNGDHHAEAEAGAGFGVDIGGGGVHVSGSVSLGF